MTDIFSTYEGTPAAAPAAPAQTPAVPDIFTKAYSQPSPPDQSKPMTKSGAAETRWGELIAKTGKDWETIPSQYKKSFDEYYSSSRAMVSEAKEGIDKANDPIHGWGSVGEGLLGVMGMIFSPVTAAADTFVTKPLQSLTTKAGEQVEKNLVPLKRDPKLKGVDWELHPDDVKNTVDSLNKFTDFTIQTAAGFALPGAEKLPGSKAATLVHDAQKVETAFDELAIKSPEAAKVVVDKVSEVDPPLGAKLKVRIKSSQVPTEQVTVGKKSALQEMGEDTSHLWKDVHEQMAPLYNKYSVDRVTSATQSVSSHSLLDEMVKHTDEGTYQRDLLTRLRETIDDVPVIFHNTDTVRYMEGGRLFNSRGLYFFDSHHVEVAARSNNPTQVLVHELVHAGTSRFIEQFPESPLTKEISRLRSIARERMRDRDFEWLNAINADKPAPHTPYGLTNEHEFVAEALANPKFQKWLMESEELSKSTDALPKQTLWSRFVGTVRKMFGITNDHTARLLENTIDISDKLLGAQKEAFAKKPLIEAGLRDTVRQAYAMMEEEDPWSLENAKGINYITGKMEEYWKEAQATFSPGSVGDGSRLTEASLAKNISRQMQADSKFYHQAVKRINYWRSNEKNIGSFMKAYELGARVKDSAMRDLQLFYQGWNAKILAQDLRNGIEYEAKDHYMMHAFEDKDNKIIEFLNKKFPGWSDPKFSKDRVFDMYTQAIKAGFKPRFKNPEELMLARQHASDIAEMRVQTLNDLQRFGLAVEKTKGSKLPDWEGFSIKSPNGKAYYVRQGAFQVLDNAFNSPSLWNKKGFWGDVFRGAMSLKNTIVPVKLGLSLFHPLHVATIDNATGMVRASKELLAGYESAPVWFARMAKSAGYVDTLKETASTLPLIDVQGSGNRMLRAWQGKVPFEKLSAADQQSMKYMFEGGFIPEMAAEFKSRAIDNFSKAIYSSSYLKKTTAVYKAPFALLSLIGKPMFEVWIPSLKIASYLKDVQTAIKVNPGILQDDAARIQNFRRLAKSVDNRYGEMAYNTLFWNRWVKDIGVAGTLSLGWQMGFIREYGGGGLDLGHVLTKSGSVAEKASEGMLDRPLFVTFYTVQALAYGGLLTYAMSGKPPQSLKDYIYPLTGEEGPNGPVRTNTMFYPREFGSIYYHVRNEGLVGGLTDIVRSKASGLIELANEWASGVDSWGNQISREGDPWYQQLAQKVKATVGDLEPISIKGGQASGHMARNVAGLGNAPKYVSQSKTEWKIDDYFNRFVRAKETPYDKAQQSKDYTELRKLYESDDPKFEDKMDEVQDKFELSGKDVKKLRKSFSKDDDPYIYKFGRLDWHQQKLLLDKMTPEERAKFLPHSNKTHLRNQYEEPK